ncbi:hypothetical protein Avbf_17730, partial [Armadillidium vulgare]
MSAFQKFQLTCSGDKPVQWKTKVDSNFLHYKSVHNDSGFYSTLMIIILLRRNKFCTSSN